MTELIVNVIEKLIVNVIEKGPLLGKDSPLSNKLAVSGPGREHN